MKNIGKIYVAYSVDYRKAAVAFKENRHTFGQLKRPLQQLRKFPKAPI
jgi:hypothetical protein